MTRVPNEYRVLMITSAAPDVWNYSMHLCRSLQNHNVFFHLINIGQPLETWQQEAAAAFSHVQLHPAVLPERDVEFDKSSSEAEHALLALSDSLQADLIHLNNYLPFTPRFHIPTVLVIHDDKIARQRTTETQAVTATDTSYFHLAKSHLDAADAVVVPSRSMADDLRSIYRTKKVFHVLYRCTCNQVAPREKRLHQVISVVDGASEDRQIKFLEAVIPYIHWPLVIADLEKSPAKDAVHLADSSPGHHISTQHLSEHLAASPIFVAAALHEPDAAFTIEAAACGCALVLSDLPAFREIWGDHAVYVDPHNAMAFANTINGLISHPFLLEEFVSRARQKAMQYTSEQMSREYRSLYQSLIRKQAPAEIISH